MPLPNGQHTFDEMVTLIQTTQNPMALSAHIHVISEGLADLLGRLRTVEFNQTEDRQRLIHLETIEASFEKRLDGVVHDRDEYKKAVDTATQLPTANEKRISDLEKRARTLEGAVGSKNYTAPPVKDPVAPEGFVPAGPDEKPEDKPRFGLFGNAPKPEPVPA